MQLNIKAELAHRFAEATQIIANIEASHTSDRTVISESLRHRPPARILADKDAHGDRSIRALVQGTSSPPKPAGFCFAE